MNIFTLSLDAQDCAMMHCDKHVIKMVTEYSQLLATAHRILDGTPTKVLSRGGMRLTRYLLPDFEQELSMMQASHVNHPCAVWTRSSIGNFLALNELLYWLNQEYSHRYGKNHAAYQRHIQSGANKPPKNIKIGDQSIRPQTMPEQYKVLGDPVTAYRNFYNHEKASFATWKGKIAGRPVPDWFSPIEVF